MLVCLEVFEKGYAPCFEDGILAASPEDAQEPAGKPISPKPRPEAPTPAHAACTLEAGLLTGTRS